MPTTSTWLEACRDQIVGTDEWRGVSHSIYQHLQETLANDRAGFFSELTAAEQLAYMNRIEQRLPTLPAYPSFMAKLSGIVDAAVAAAADRPDAPCADRTRLERILECTSAAAAALLEASPDATPDETHERLQILTNVAIPPTLRRQVWRLCMAMPSARAPFQASLSASNGLLRERQLEIAAQCEATLLERFPAMLSNADVVRCMREVLSFRDQESGPIPAHAYYVIVPALIAYDVVDDGLAVAEHMSTYDLARYVPRAQNPDALMAFVARLDADLRQKDAELYAGKVVERAANERQGAPVAEGWHPLRRFPVVSALEAALDDMCDYAFVRICSAPVVLYVWDQLILSRWQMLPQLCVAFLVCLRATLLKCTSPAAFQQAIKRMGPHLQQRAFQRAVSLLYPVPRPAATFDRQAGILPALPAIDNNPKYLAALCKFDNDDDDDDEGDAKRVAVNMNTWRRRARHVGLWVQFIRRRFHHLSAAKYDFVDHSTRTVLHAVDALFGFQRPP
ncbi:hypothetical protein PBRA_008138 [Plasmodiophora brassicae]|uniref:Uncharacterized protein n=1 Tax=Plasmodiophora brassicae TaxID=37360 RepID=A0A0G4J0K2_PLABS|nr:hypothetical protein PBRA_008138 [Plasmodiophora brassicae]